MRRLAIGLLVLSGALSTLARSGARASTCAFEVDAVMGSELCDGAPIAIRGTFSARG
jgi:hypothetical protein